MIRFLVLCLCLVQNVVLSTKVADFAGGKSARNDDDDNRNIHLNDDETAAAAAAIVSPRSLAVVDIPSYKGVVDDISDDSPTTITSTMPCKDNVHLTPEDWDLYQLKLESNYCYVIQVHRVNCDTLAEFSLYKGIATAANSPIEPSGGEAFVGVSSPLARSGPGYSIDSPSPTTKYCSAAEARDWTDPWYRTAPIVDGGSNYTLAVHYTTRYSSCPAAGSSNQYEYEISIEKEHCPVGENAYDGTIDVTDSVTTVKHSTMCQKPYGSDVPEFWSLWHVNLTADHCYSFLASSGAYWSAAISLYEGTATGVKSGSNRNDPNALLDATLLEGLTTTVFSHDTYGGLSMEKEMNTTNNNMNANEVAPYTLAVHHWCNEIQGKDVSIRVEQKPCKGLLESCTDSTECLSNICTGRPGKEKKCRFCARKKQICSSGTDCCQGRKLPNRYCSNNGQCQKRTSPFILTYKYDYGSDRYDTWDTYKYSVIDTKTGDETALKYYRTSGLTSTTAEQPEEIRTIAGEMEYDRTTGTLWTTSRTRTGGAPVLHKRDAFYNEMDQFSLSADISCMESVNGELYAIMRRQDEEEDTLVTIDQTNGVPSAIIGAIPRLEFIQQQRMLGLAHDGTTMYGLIRDMEVYPDKSHLVKIDTGTGTIMESSSVPLEAFVASSFGDFFVTSFNSLDADSDGVLYANRDSGSFMGFYRIDKATGQGEQISGKTATAFTMAN